MMATEVSTTTEDVEDIIHTVDLGFAEKCDNKIYLSPLFYPSKLGGRPAWLRWEGLPNDKQLKCTNCGRQMVFLCQIYVPIELPKHGEDAQLYHRTLYLFCCREGPCSKSPAFIKVFRTERLQLPDEPNYEELEKSDGELDELRRALEKPMNLCNLCGCIGDKVCSSCHEVKYCCKEHQAIDWKYQHKNQCHNTDDYIPPPYNHRKHPLLFNEHEIVIEEEPPAKPISANIQYTSDDVTKPTDKQLEKDLLKLENQKVDETFANFRERIDREPEQIIRYDLGGRPLWVSSDDQPTWRDIPHCPLCGAKRQFEFQVLPQLINHLGVETTVDSIDWGTLCVYTCSDNCIGDDGHTYREEFVWKQDFL